MRTPGHPALMTTGLMVAALAAFHIARPVAVSAQASATLTVSATVVRAEAAWSGHEMSRALVRAAASEELVAEAASLRTLPNTVMGAGASVERDGTVAWLEPAPEAARTRTVTVAHLGS